MNDTAIEENLGLVGDAIKAFQGLFEFIIVVGTERLDPRLDFLGTVSSIPVDCVRRRLHPPVLKTWCPW
jgi:hypothetical protein